ncbi:hypothetical protein MKK64_00425 [Methylobacterium sp. E-025]|uniref:hypothetical protein n=1 Tax=Methylobacterium sp. E-025 TaxID=2836561 RepID=UPI001FBB5AA7|nr:hypothetical protein [Methylobacterium sp. E-025]MCJ2109692.1 hypothetical protein [Methylobacterium sp. E-025]
MQSEHDPPVHQGCRIEGVADRIPAGGKVGRGEPDLEPRRLEATAWIGLAEQEQVAVGPEGFDGQDAGPHRMLAAQALAQPAKKVAQLADLVGGPGRPRVVRRDGGRTDIARVSRGCVRPTVCVNRLLQKSLVGLSER